MTHFPPLPLTLLRATPSRPHPALHVLLHPRLYPFKATMLFSVSLFVGALFVASPDSAFIGVLNGSNQLVLTPPVGGQVLIDGVSGLGLPLSLSLSNTHA